MRIFRIRAVLKIDRNSTSSVLKRAHAVYTCMGAAPAQFPAPVPPLPDLQAQIVKVTAAEQLIDTRAKGAAAARTVQRTILVNMLETQRSYVQTLCDASPELAAAIIEAAGMVVAARPTRNDPVLSIRAGAQSGSANLDANATALGSKSGRKTFFNWQWTIDGGKTFVNAPSTARAKTTIENLPPLTMVGFRVNVAGVDGPGEWSPIVTVLVH